MCHRPTQDITDQYTYILACSDDEKQRLVFELGRAQRENVSTDSSEMGSIFRNIELLKALDVNVFLKKRDKVVLSLLDGLSEDYASNLTK